MLVFQIQLKQYCLLVMLSLYVCKDMNLKEKCDYLLSICYSSSFIMKVLVCP